MTPQERNKEVKKILSKSFGQKNVSVRGGKGTAYGWCDITIKTEDPCPFKQHVDPCSLYCEDGICKGNNKPIQEGWGDTVRQEKWSTIQEQGKSLLTNIKFSHFYADDGYNTKCDKMNIDVVFV